MSVEQVKYILFICKNYSLVCNPHEYEWVQLPNMIFEDKNSAIEYLQSEELQTHFEELKNSILLQMYEYLQKFKSNITKISREDITDVRFIFDEMKLIKYEWLLKKYNMDEIESMFEENPYNLLQNGIYFRFLKI
jgi:hypothetical protein